MSKQARVGKRTVNRGWRLVHAYDILQKEGLYHRVRHNQLFEGLSKATVWRDIESLKLLVKLFDEYEAPITRDAPKAVRMALGVLVFREEEQYGMDKHMEIFPNISEPTAWRDVDGVKAILVRSGDDEYISVQGTKR